eukprot:gene19495-biopygen36864
MEATACRYELHCSQKHIVRLQLSWCCRDRGSGAAAAWGMRLHAGWGGRAASRRVRGKRQRRRKRGWQTHVRTVMHLGTCLVSTQKVCTPRRRIRSVPKTLWLMSTTRRNTYAGFYRLVAGRETNGMPMWNWGDMWLYSSSEGEWIVTDDEKDMEDDIGGIKSAVHGGLMPDAVTGWESYGDEKWQADTGVSVTSDRGSGAAAA